MAKCLGGTHQNANLSNCKLRKREFITQDKKMRLWVKNIKYWVYIKNRMQPYIFCLSFESGKSGRYSVLFQYYGMQYCKLLENWFGILHLFFLPDTIVQAKSLEGTQITGKTRGYLYQRVLPDTIWYKIGGKTLVQFVHKLNRSRKIKKVILNQ